MIRCCLQVHYCFCFTHAPPNYYSMYVKSTNKETLHIHTERTERRNAFFRSNAKEGSCCHLYQQQVILRRRWQVVGSEPVVGGESAKQRGNLIFCRVRHEGGLSVCLFVCLSVCLLDG